MAQDRIERLHYYQRQYLGAGDFEAQQDYHRCMRRRHNVGPHTQGIVAGLELVEVEQEGGGGGVDVFVLPGLAVDGFGREIVVLAPYRLEGRLFEPFRNQGDRFLPVWIAYDEELTQRPRPGFELCDEEDQFARVRETFRVVIDPVAPFHDDLVVAGHRVEPGERPDPAGAEDVSTLLAAPRDASVPHQELPDDEDRPRWLVRVGNVHWDGQKLVPDDADPPLLNQDRQYLGAVTEEVLAPRGRLVLRHRWSPEVLSPKDEPEGSDDPDFGVQAELQGSLRVDRLLTAKADVQIHGGKLDFRNAGGDGGGPRFTLHRDEAGGAGGIDLRLKIGDDSAGANRFTIDSGTDRKLTVADDGSTEVDGDLTVLNQKALTVDGGRLALQKQGQNLPDWAVEVEGEDLRFLEPDDGDRVVFEILDVAGDLTAPSIRLHGEADATLSASQLIDLTDGGDTSLHTHPGATTLAKGMVEIAQPGETATLGDSGARLVVPANDPRLLTQAQKDELTDGGLTTLHRHPNGLLNDVEAVLLWASDSARTDIVEVNLGTQKRVVAMISLRAVDPLADFDRGDAFFADIFRIDGVRPPGQSFNGGDHLGPPNNDSNLMIPIYTGLATRVTFRLRSMQDAEAWAVGVVFFEDP